MAWRQLIIRASPLQVNEGCREISRRIWRSAPPLLEAFFPRRQDRPPGQFLRQAAPSSVYLPLVVNQSSLLMHYATITWDQKQSTFRNRTGSIQLFEKMGAFDCTTLAMAPRGPGGTVTVDFLALPHRERAFVNSTRTTFPSPISSCIPTALPNFNVSTEFRDSYYSTFHEEFLFRPSSPIY